MKNKIKEVLKERGITQKELCSMVGMSEAGISGAINGSANKETIAKIAKALEMQPTELILLSRLRLPPTPMLSTSILLTVARRGWQFRFLRSSSSSRERSTT